MHRPFYLTHVGEFFSRQAAGPKSTNEDTWRERLVEKQVSEASSTRVIDQLYLHGFEETHHIVPVLREECQPLPSVQERPLPFEK